MYKALWNDSVISSVRRTEAARVELCVCESRRERREGEGVTALIDSNDIFAPRATARV